MRELEIGNTPFRKTYGLRAILSLPPSRGEARRGVPISGGGEMALYNEVLKYADAVIEAIGIEVAPPH